MVLCTPKSETVIQYRLPSWIVEGEIHESGQTIVRVLKNQLKSIRNHEFQKLELELRVRFFQDFEIVQKNGRRGISMIFCF